MRFANFSNFPFREISDKASKIAWIELFKKRCYRMNVTTVYLVVDDPFNIANFYNQRDLVAGFSIGSFQRFFEILGFLAS